jgi:M6 family metalloprotease-like protein
MCTVIFLFIFLIVETFAIAPPKTGVKPSAQIIEEFKEIQKSYGNGYWAEKVQSRYELLQKNPSLLKANPAISTDTTNVITLLGYFTDLAQTYTPNNFQAQLWSGPNANGTITDYYHEISYGKMYLTGTCEGWFPVSGNLASYGPGGSSGGPKFVYETLVASDATVDYRNYIKYYDAQGNGHVPFLVVVHTGGGAEAGASNIWSHRWDFKNYSGTTYTTNDILPNGKNVIVDGPYSIQPEMAGSQNSGGSIIQIGVFCHELGHVFGLPDLYDLATSSPGEGLGGWCLMASGSWGGNNSNPSKPAHMSAWCKEQMGWVVPTVVTSDVFNAILNPVEYTQQIYKLWRGGIPGGEYFLIENRRKEGFDISLIESGLLVFHVDNSVSRQNNKDHYKVDLEQADGLRNLNLGSNRGDSGDPFPGTGGSNNPNIVFDGYSTPNSKDYLNAFTGVNVNNIRKVDSLVYVNIAVWDTTIVVQAYSNTTTIAGVSDSSESYGTSSADYDNDGSMDIYVANTTANRLYRNNGNGTFTNTAAAAGVADTDPSRSGIWADVNNDGFKDLYVTTYNPLPLIKKKNKLFINNGDGTFRNDTTSSLYFSDKSVNAAFADYNNDGYLDVFVVNEFNKSKLYTNNGDETFTLDTLSGLIYQAKGSSATWGDYNNDGYMDLYIVTKDQYTPSALWKNNSDGTFTNVTTTAGVGNLAYGQSAAWGDFNNDGFIDLAVCNENGANRLYKNNSDQTFTDVAAIVGVSDGGINYSPLWVDYDLDGYLDLYITRNGPKRLFRNNGNGTFSEVAGRMGVSTTQSTRGVTLFDYDKNGLPDLYLVNLSAFAPNVLFNHTDLTNSWLTVDVKGTQSNRDGVGTRITVVANGIRQTREVNGASGFASQNSLTQFFGLGNASSIDSAIITFPSGNRFVGTNLPLNRPLFVEENTGAIYIPLHPNLLLPPNASTNQPEPLTLQWRSSYSAVNYKLQIAPDTAFNFLIVDDPTLIDTVYQVSSLQNSSIYYWRVSAKNGNGSSSFSSTWNFTTPLTAPALISPTNESIDQQRVLTFSWSQSSGAKNYNLQVSVDSLFTTFIINDSSLMSASRQVGPLQGLTTFYWRVKSMNSGDISPWSEIFKLTTKNISTFYIPVSKNWNLLSIPMELTESTKDSVFPKAVSSAYEFKDGSYLAVDTLKNSVGYWLKFDTTQTIQNEGSPILTDTIEIKSGWNLIGTISDTVNTSSILQIPDGIISSSFYGYESGYLVATSLIPGKAYWIKAIQNGKLVITKITIEKFSVEKSLKYNGQ